MPGSGRVVRGGFIIILLGALVASSAIVATNSLARPGSGASLHDPACEPEYVEKLGPACILPNGHFRVFLSDGTSLITHGPDPVPPDGDPGFVASSDQRAPVCAAEWHLHALYGHPPSAESRFDAIAADLRAALRRMNAVLNADAIASGNVSADYRMHCDANGEIQIDVFQGPETGGAVYTTDFSAVVNAAKAAGHSSPTADYLIFYDDTSEGVCGVGNLANDDSLSETNTNMMGPDYGVAYKNCFFGRTPMHENGHTQGAVQDLAPMWDASGHCLEGMDVMCYPTSSILVLCEDRIHYDCNFDTYFDAGPEPGEWLATHWNIGSRLNRYIEFSDVTYNEPAPAPSSSGTPTPPSENDPPVPRFTYATDGRTVHTDATDSYDPEGHQLTYVWDWGDGEGGDHGETYSHSYRSDGKFIVTLTASDAYGASRILQKEVSVDDGIANSAPRASFRTDPEAPAPGGEVQFIDESTDADGRITAYRWSFSDGQTSDKRFPRRSFDEGVYSIELTVTDDQGGRDSLVRSLKVEKPAVPDKATPNAVEDPGPRPRNVPLPGVLSLLGLSAALFLVRQRR